MIQQFQRRYVKEDEAATILGVPPREVRRLPGLLYCRVGPRTIRYDVVDLREYRLRMPPPSNTASMLAFIRECIARHPSDGGFIYFMRCQGIVKIGWSRQPPVRHRRFRSIIPFELTLIGFTPGSKAAEQEIHKRISPLRCGHLQEWFSPTPALTEAIEALCK